MQVRGKEILRNEVSRLEYVATPSLDTDIHVDCVNATLLNNSGGVLSQGEVYV